MSADLNLGKNRPTDSSADSAPAEPNRISQSSAPDADLNDPSLASPSSERALALAAYVRAFGSLSETEQIALHAVEVHQMRYSEVAAILNERAGTPEYNEEAVAEVVFRARRSIYRTLTGNDEPEPEALDI